MPFDAKFSYRQVAAQAHRCHFESLWLYWSKKSSMVLGSYIFGQSNVWPPRDAWALVTYIIPRPSDNSTWSCFGLPDLVSRQSKSTLPMWAAASLNISLIDHLLQVGVSIHEQDSTERTALRYVASPSENAA